jgi:hypothetical protein
MSETEVGRLPVVQKRKSRWRHFSAAPAAITVSIDRRPSTTPAQRPSLVDTIKDSNRALPEPHCPADGSGVNRGEGHML